MALTTGPNLGLLMEGAPGDEHYALLMRRWRALDSLIMPYVVNRTTNDPPATANEGETYIVGPIPTGDWLGHARDVARWSNTLSAWEFYAPRDGWEVYDGDVDAKVVYQGGFWIDARVAFAGDKVTTLFDEANIPINAGLGSTFRVTLAGNRTFDNPSNLKNGQVLNFRIKQDATGNRTLSFGSKYKFAGGTPPVLSTAAGALDFMSCQYDATDDTLVCVLNKAFA